MPPKVQHGLKLGAIGAACAALLAIGAMWGKINAIADDRIRSVARQCIEETVGRNVRVLVEINRQKAQGDSMELKIWNRAIDIVDNAGRIK